MKKDVYFYYDESAHSRKLTSDTLNDSLFRQDFISTIVGIPKDIYNAFEKKFLAFEQKWKRHYSCDELKSTLIKSKKYKYGLASFLKEDADLYDDLFSMLLEHHIFLYFGVFNKIQYLMLQMIEKYAKSAIINAKALSYSMAKALCVYRPKKVLEAIENNTSQFLPLFKNFLEKRRVLNKRINGESEEMAFSQMLYILNTINNDIDLTWDYTFSFDGFKKYINEMKLTIVSLSIDKEGSGNTIKCAIRDGIKNVSEADSKATFGVRCADLLSGFLSNMISSVEEETSYSEDETTRDESLLSPKWFDNIGEKKFVLYKKAFAVFYELNNSWFKYYCSSYCDGLMIFLALLKHINEYKNYGDYRTDNFDYHQHRANSILYWDLKRHYDELSGRYKIEIADIGEDGLMYNQKGAKFYSNTSKLNMIVLPKDGEEIELFALSVGFIPEKNKPFSQPIITISEDGAPICYLLPKEFGEKVMHYISLSVAGYNQFPSFIVIKNSGGNYSFDLILK